MAHQVKSKINKGCYNCYLSQNIENEVCEDCGKDDFYPVFFEPLGKADKEEWILFAALEEDEQSYIYL